MTLLSQRGHPAGFGTSSKGLLGLLVALIAILLLSCAQEPPMDLDQVEARTRALAEAAAAGIAPEVEAVPDPDNKLDACAGEGFRLQPIYDLELRWAPGEFDRIALRDRAERYFHQQGYDVQIENPDSDVIDVIAQTADFNIIVRAMIIEESRELVIYGTGPCVTVDGDTYLDRYP
jgi:hypothetical protein